MPSVSQDINFSGFQLRTAWKYPDNPAWGISFNAKSLSPLPVSFKAGQISVSGPVSKLKTPALSSSANPFCPSVSAVSSPSVSLPQASGWSKPQAISCIFDYSSYRNNLQKLNFTHFIDSDGLMVEEFSVKVTPFQKVSISLSGATGIFSTENSSQSWYSSTYLFPAYRQVPLCFQLGLFSNHFKTRETFCHFTGFNQENYYTFSSENTITIGDFSLNIAGFSASSTEIFTASSTHLKTLCQLKLNPQISLYGPRNLFRLRMGTGAVAEEKLTTDGFLQTLKLSQGFELKTVKTCCQLLINLTDLEDTFSKYSWNSSLSLTMQSFLKPKTTVSVAVNPHTEKLTVKLGSKLTVPVKQLKTLAFNTTFNSEKAKLKDINFAFTTGCRLKTKTVTMNATASVSLCLKDVF